MTAYTDQEQVERLKVWFKDYGGALLVGVLLGLAILFGNKYWRQYQEEQRVAASELYAQMLQQVQESKTDAARVLGKKLTDEYKRTPYSGMAALMLARLSFEANDRAGARQHLEWAMEHAADPAVENAARLRLGRLHIANKEYDAALALAQKSAAGFDADYLEIKGDAYAGMGRIEEARAAYRDALKTLTPDVPARRLIEMKLDDLGGDRAQ